MKLRLFVFVPAALGLASLLTTAPAGAQEASPAPSPIPASGQPTRMDRAYDGQLHVTLAPYAWLPTVTQNVQYTIPTLTNPITTQTTLQVGPTSYLSKVNAAAMFSADARQGIVDFFGDYIYTNVSTSSSFTTTISGPLGKIKIPVTLNTSSRLSSSIWEVAAALSLWHDHNADVNAFAGWRDFPINLTLDYNAVIGKRGIIMPSGTIVEKPLADDAVFGLRGKAFLGDGNWYVPYYIDYGVGPNNQSWQGFAGAGYTFDHGQSLLLVYRSLNYDSFTAGSPIQKLSLSGPLLGYTFQL
jgi:hypothetical protein